MLRILTEDLRDATVAPDDLAGMARRAADRSFNCVSVEGHTSTHDTLLLFANGAGERLTGVVLGQFEEAVTAVCGELARAIAADATQLDMFADREFDVVFACAALHHTLKYPGAVEELARVMKPGALFVLCETWGGNPMLNAARRLRSVLAGEQEEQGEGVIISYQELRALYPFFDDLRIDTKNLLAMGKRLLRGRFDRVWARSLMHVLESVDSALLAVAPALRNWCGEALITARRR